MTRFEHRTGHINVVYGLDHTTGYFLAIEDGRLTFQEDASDEVNAIVHKIGIKDGGGSYFDLHTGDMGFGMKVSKATIIEFYKRYNVDQAFIDSIIDLNTSPIEPIQSNPSIANYNMDPKVLEYKEEGNRLFKNGDIRGAIPKYLAAIKIINETPFNNKNIYMQILPNLCNNLSLCFYKINEAQDALDFAEKSIFLVRNKTNFTDKDRAKAYFRKANALMLLKQHKEAETIFKKALSFQPNDSTIQSAYKECIAKLNRLVTLALLDLNAAYQHLLHCVIKDLLPSDPSCLNAFLFNTCNNKEEEIKLFGVYIGLLKLTPDFDATAFIQNAKQDTLPEYIKEKSKGLNSNYLTWFKNKF